MAKAASRREVPIAPASAKIDQLLTSVSKQVRFFISKDLQYNIYAIYGYLTTALYNQYIFSLINYLKLVPGLC